MASKFSKAQVLPELRRKSKLLEKYGPVDKAAWSTYDIAMLFGMLLDIAILQLGGYRMAWKMVYALLLSGRRLLHSPVGCGRDGQIRAAM